jgi:hypothetical protein
VPKVAYAPGHDLVRQGDEEGIDVAGLGHQGLHGGHGVPEGVGTSAAIAGTTSGVSALRRSSSFRFPAVNVSRSSGGPSGRVQLEQEVWGRG